ncbi:single-stranded-DNA-specific exonuclease RecJ [Patescibacteria group bacterium]|nr:single-stranded-DNA-specific exonuclease RecJ [Patescibacteria group bacterium]MCG2695236.1 single-stranded-DNA-specific exonuclease RecJ [Candidatus Parcubacteria bacterium]
MQKFVLTDNNLPEKAKKEFEIYPELLGQLLFSRGIETREEAEKFLKPDYYRDTYDPFLLKDMKKSVERILKAINQNEKILIFSDYDADGIPGAVVLHDFFKKIGYKNFENYIPHRHNEGYSLNIEAIKKFSENGVTLIITIDCGISDIEEIKEAQKLGMDVIVTDHHVVGEKIPSAFAIINPKQEDCNYPDDGLAGAGVIFKLVQALISEIILRVSHTPAPLHSAKGERHPFVFPEIKEGWEKWLLDMVGLATISDMVPLRNENRIFSYFGMMVLRKTPRYGIIYLLRELKINQRTLVEDDLSFMVTPRINVASRIDNPDKAFRLLSTNDEVEARELAHYLDGINDTRKKLVTVMVREANKKLKEREVGAVVVVGSPKWNPGVSGLVASSLVEKHKKSCFVWGQSGDGCIKGSCRSCGEIDVIDLMRSVEEGAFLNVGGHKMAGGFTVMNNSIHTLEKKLNDAYQKIEKTGVKKEFLVDKKVSLDEINWETYKIVEKLAPFGVGNEKPLFLIESIEIFNVRIFGKQNNHLGLDFRNKNGQNISAIKFFADEIKNGETKIKRGDKVSLLANLEKSTFRNVNELRLRIVDFI